MSHRDRDYYDRNSNSHRRDDNNRDTRDRGGGGSSRDRHRDDYDSRRNNDSHRRSDRDRHSPSSYDAEYESRRFRDRRDQQRQRDEKYSRRSRSPENSRRHGNDEDRRRDHRSESGREATSRRHNSSYSDDSSSRDNNYEKRTTKHNESRGAAADSPSRERTECETYLSKMSDEKLQESFDRYAADPDCDITDGLLDNIVIDKEKIQAEMQERLRQHLLSEGKVYPPPKPEPPQQTTAFANDGSFLDMFKKMQEEQQAAGTAEAGGSAQAAGSEPQKAATEVMVAKPRPVGPMFGKRRGGKILKTGIVEKKKPVEDLSADAAPGDAWSQYMKEVKRYKAVSCDVDNKNRPLVK